MELDTIAHDFFFYQLLFGNIALINSLDKSYIFWYGGFIFLSVYALTDLMDRKFIGYRVGTAT
jgi:hypothetical protein